MNTLVTIGTDGKVSRQQFTRLPELDDLKKPLDGGWLEVVPFFNKFEGQRCVAFCDEEGNINMDFPRAKWNTRFRATAVADVTLVSIAVRYESLADLEKIIGFGTGPRTVFENKAVLESGDARPWKSPVMIGRQFLPGPFRTRGLHATSVPASAAFGP